MSMKILLAVVPVLAFAGLTNAAILYTNDFEVDTTASWTTNKGPATTDGAANHFFDYSTAGIPVAPGTVGTSRRGLKLIANASSGVFGGISTSPTGQSFGSNYTLSFDWWGNYNGPFPVGGSGSTQLSTFGVGTSGTTSQWPGGVQDSTWFAATGDGNSASDWRAYSPSAAGALRYADTVAGIYAAGAVAGSSNSSNSYYSSFGSVTAPADQLTLFPQQTGTTGAGSAGMEWHQVQILKQGASVTWIVDGLLIATVPVADDSVLTGENIFFGHADTNATSSTDVNDTALLFTLIDNVVVTPEPTSLSALAMGSLLLGRRRK